MSVAGKAVRRSLRIKAQLDKTGGVVPGTILRRDKYGQYVMGIDGTERYDPIYAARGRGKRRQWKTILEWEEHDKQIDAKKEQKKTQQNAKTSPPDNKQEKKGKAAANKKETGNKQQKKKKTKSRKPNAAFNKKVKPRQRTPQQNDHPPHTQKIKGQTSASIGSPTKIGKGLPKAIREILALEKRKQARKHTDKRRYVPCLSLLFEKRKKLCA